MNSPHILSSFDAALQTLSDQIVTMGNEVVTMIERAGQAFRDHDVAVARAVVQADLSIDSQYDAINANVMATLSRFQPVARDLRDVLAIEHIATFLERIADHAKSISKRTIAVAAPAARGQSAEILDRLLSLVETTLKETLVALEARDAGLANHVRRGDDRIDRLYDDLFHAAVADIRERPELADVSVHLLFVAKSLERIGDHATNIAEEVRFMTVGEALTATRRT